MSVDLTVRGLEPEADRGGAAPPVGGVTGPIVVAELTGPDEGQWEEFVRGCPDALPHHLLGWRSVIAQTYGFRSRYLVAKRGGQIVGVMPLFEVVSRLQGHHLTTLPDGICAPDPAAGLALVERAKALTVSRNARFLAIRDTRRRWDAGLVTHAGEVAIFTDVSGGLDDAKKGLAQLARRCLKKAAGTGVELREGADQIDAYYAAFAAFSRSRGTPVYPKRLLVSMLENLGRDAALVGAWHAGRLVGGSIKLPLGEAVHDFALFTLDEHLKLYPNHLMYWDLIEYAVRHGYRRADWGRSQIGSGQHQFKLQWGKNEVPVYQQFFLHRARRAPMIADDAARGGGRAIARVWRRLPLGVTTILGPRIRRQLPFV